MTISNGHFQRFNAIAEHSGELPSLELRVLLGLERHADVNGNAFPSVMRLAGYCGQKDRRHIQRALRNLDKTGWIKTISPGGGRNHPTVYQILTPQTVAATATVSVTNSGEKRTETVAIGAQYSGERRTQTEAATAARSTQEGLNKQHNKGSDDRFFSQKDFLGGININWTPQVKTGIEEHEWTTSELKDRWKSITTQYPQGSRQGPMASAIATGDKGRTQKAEGF